jgi:predicted transposase/invertase (TIGR01784 family)
MRFINPKTDFAFKRIFGGPDSKDILISFLNAMIYNGESIIEDLEILDPYQSAQLQGLKDTYLDVKARLNTGELVIIEMQVLNVDSFGKRILYNAAKAYSIQLDSGESYWSLKPVIALTITDFIMFPESEKIISHFVFKELESNLKYRDNDIDLVFVELPKFKNTIEQIQSLTEKWIYFMKDASHLDKIPEKMISDTAINKAFNIANRTNLTREELEDLEKREMFIADQQAVLIKAEKEKIKARQEGRQEGIDLGIKQVAKNLLNSGMTVEKVAELTGLSHEQINSL